MIGFEVKGGFENTLSLLKKIKNFDVKHILDKYGKMGVEALKEATPVDTGETADSWFYEIESEKDRHKIMWKNSNEVDGVSIAIILQYGHATKNGGYVRGVDYINPALKPVFEQIREELGEEVANL